MLYINIMMQRLMTLVLASSIVPSPLKGMELRESTEAVSQTRVQRYLEEMLAKEKTAVHWLAAKVSYSKVVELLIEWGVDMVECIY